MDPNSYRQIAETKYREIEKKYGLTVYGSRTHQSIRLVFARGRIADPENLTPLENQFGYPPVECCNEIGRAHYPRQPVMYVGESPNVIAAELRLTKNDWFHIAIFYTPRSVNFNYLLLLHEGMPDTNVWKKILLESKKHFMSSLPPKHSETPQQVWNRIQSAALCFRKNNYEETAAIAFHWLYVRGVDAILYPSIRTDDYCNFALSADFVDQHLALYRVHACRWLGENLEFHHTGKLEGKFLVWNKTSRGDWSDFENGYRSLLS